jgi:TonB family protein
MAKANTAILLTLALTLGLAARAAQHQKSARGPAVTAYLVNLEEEIKELDFQLRHQEISRRDYGRTRARLLLQFKYVERLVAESREDSVPEIQVLTGDEVSALLLGGAEVGGELRAGEMVNKHWRVVAVEQRGEKFFVLARPPSAKPGGEVGRPRRHVNPLDVIETVRVEEPQENTATTNRAVVEAAPLKTTVNENAFAAPPEVDESRPRIRALYLPRYTAKAREKGVEGKIVLSALFGRDGKVKDIVVESKLGHGLDESALAAARQIVFDPARLAGQPVDARAQVIFTFVQNNVIARVQPLPLGSSNQKGN